MGLLDRIIRKVLLTREIISREGVVHFRRYRLLQTKFGGLYVHHILESDRDLDPHDHPWWFASLILKGGYVERRWSDDRDVSTMKLCQPGNLNVSPTTMFHRIALTGPTWTLVVTGPRTHDRWGYLTHGGFVDHETYRLEKNSKNNG